MTEKFNIKGSFVYVDWDEVAHYIAGDKKPTKEMMDFYHKIKASNDGKELKHHGIQGQKWGVKNGPPYPLDHGGDEKIKAGTNVSRFSRVGSDTELKDYKSGRGFTYVSRNENDKDREESKKTWTKYLGPYNTKNRNEYQTKKDMNIAGYDTIKDILYNKISEQERYRITLAAFNRWNSIYGSYEGYKQPILRYTKIANGESYGETLNKFVKGDKSGTDLTGFVATQLVDPNSPLRSCLNRELPKAGYDGLVDIFGRNDGDPTATIILDPGKNLDIKHSAMPERSSYMIQKDVGYKVNRIVTKQPDAKKNTVPEEKNATKTPFETAMEQLKKKKEEK